MKFITLLIIMSGFSAVLNAQLFTSLRLDPDNALGGTSSDIFENVTFIPLETTKQSTFGKVTKLEVTDEYFIIFDADTDAVLIFALDGTFHAKISKRNAREYFGVFTLNRFAKEIILCTGNKALIYTYDAKFIREIKIPQDVGGIHYLNSDTIVYHINRPLDYSKNSHQKFDLVYSNGFDRPFKSFLPYDSKYVKYEYNLPANLFSPQNDGTFFFSMPYEYKIVQLGTKGIVHEYLLNFPLKYSLPNNFSTDSSFTGKRKEYIFRGYNRPHKDNYYELSPFFITADNYLLFHAQNISRIYTDKRDFLYSLKTGSLYSLNRIAGDNLSSAIPVLNKHLGQHMHHVKDHCLYTSISAIDLFEANSTNQTGVEVNTELSHFFFKGKKTDNPIIIISKLKTGL